MIKLNNNIPKNERKFLAWRIHMNEYVGKTLEVEGITDAGNIHSRGINFHPDWCKLV